MFTRNRFLLLATGAAAGAGLRPLRVDAAAVSARMTAPEAWQALLAGNRRYMNDQLVHTEHTARREETTAKQHPFAIVLSCSDSRVPPEILFDQGIGDLFVVRVAGNVADALGIGSIEYAVSHFACSLLVVLGHTNCGAVRAAVDVLGSGHAAPGHIAAIVQEIAPAVESARTKVGDVYLNVTKANAIAVAAKANRSEPIIAPAVKEKRLEVVAALYSLQTGRVSLL